MNKPQDKEPRNSTESMIGTARKVVDTSKPPVLIGITGAAGSGKDTVAAFMLEVLTTFQPYALASPIKEMLKVGLGLTDADKNTIRAEEAYGRSYRHIAQTLGTEWGRKCVSEDIWLRIAEKRLAGRRAIITDVRFENEAEWVRKHGILVHVDRPSLVKIAESDHSSEAGIVRLYDDWIINNTGSLEDLKSSAALIAAYLYDLLITDKLQKQEQAPTPQSDSDLHLQIDLPLSE